MRRINLLLIAFAIGFLTIIGRLFYWQVIASESLKAQADRQHYQTLEIPAPRGEIFTADSFPLVANQPSFLLYALPKEIEEPPETIAARLASITINIQEPGKGDLEEEEKRLRTRLSETDLFWVVLARGLNEKQKNKIDQLKISGFGLEEEEKRIYPEASMAAQLLGFVGSDEYGNPRGYYGLEGFYERSLAGKPGKLSFEKDASGRPILLGEGFEEEAISGSSLILNLERSIQFIIEEELKKGLERYQAKSGSIIVIDPETGEILAMASFPSFDPVYFNQFDQVLYASPVIADSFEPGSIFKILVMAAAIEERAVAADEKCEKCSGPRQIGEYTIRTWNNEYHPDSTMTEILEHSDNVGMVYVGEKLGVKKLYSYLKKFGFGERTKIDLEGETLSLLRPENKWYEVDLATASFGQGIAVTPIQMAMAVAAIANKGKLMEPHIVSQIIQDGKEISIKPKNIRSVISSVTARIITEMMVKAVDNGEAKWAKPKDFRIAGKTGTAQIPVAGHYDQEKTIASFVGFAPADDPKFVMLVTLCEPSTSPWGSETAAPLWFEIAKKLFAHWGISPK